MVGAPGSSNNQTESGDGLRSRSLLGVDQPDRTKPDAEPGRSNKPDQGCLLQQAAGALGHPGEARAAENPFFSKHSTVQ